MSNRNILLNPGIRLAYLLALAGAIPFISAAGIVSLGAVEYQPLAVQGATTYAAVILSFLGGIQWGIGLSLTSDAPRSAQTLLLLSVVPSLLAWALLFVAQPNARVLVAIFLFGFVWVVDALLSLQKLIPPWFFRLRCIVTAAVIASMAIIAIKI